MDSKKKQQIVSSTLKDILLCLSKAGRMCILYRDMDRLEEWDIKNTVKFNNKEVQGPAPGTKLSIGQDLWAEAQPC